MKIFYLRTLGRVQYLVIYRGWVGLLRDFTYKSNDALPPFLKLFPHYTKFTIMQFFRGYWIIESVDVNTNYELFMKRLIWERIGIANKQHEWKQPLYHILQEDSLQTEYLVFKIKHENVVGHITATISLFQLKNCSRNSRIHREK